LKWGGLGKEWLGGTMEGQAREGSGRSCQPKKV
jgi:hypothetical protein